MNAEALLSLQRIDTELDALPFRRRRLPELAALNEVKARKKDWQQRLTAQQEAVAAAQALIVAAEAQGTTITTKRTRLEAQLKTIIAPREAEALMHEIALLNDQRNAVDDGELAAMEQQSDAETAIADLDVELPQIEADLDGATGAFSEVAAVLDSEEATLRSRSEEIRSVLSSDELDTYDSLRKRFNGVGIATLDGTRCTGCHLDLSRSEVEQVKAPPADELPECPQCGRLLAR